MDPPAQFLCPISRDIMREPVMLVETGQVYERAFIEQWLIRGNTTDPLTNVAISDKKLAPVLSLRSLIEQWMEQQRARQRLGIAEMDASIPLITQEQLVLGEVLHGGALATVYVAVLKPAGQEVVVKMFHARGVTEVESAKFRKEVQILHQASIFCHNVCRLIGVAVINGQLCMVMPRYKASLEEVLLKQQESSAQAASNAGATAPQPLPLDRILSITQDIALAIADLHERGILVLDLKPANVLMDKYGRALVADFGISALRNSSMSRHVPTTGAQGTPNYMAPEQWLPEESGGVTTAADAWGFGCVVVEMASGTAPWAGMSMFQIMTCVTPPRQQSPSIPDSLPGFLVDLLRRCFAYQPAHRPSFQEILAVVRQASMNLIVVQVVPHQPPTPVPAAPAPFSAPALPSSASAAFSAPAPSSAPAPFSAPQQPAPERFAVSVAAPVHAPTKERSWAASLASKLSKVVSSTADDGMTALHSESQAGRLDIVQQLLARRANTEARDKDGNTPLRYACENGHLPVVQHLIANGANFEAKNKNGATPLHIASGKGHLDVVAHLVTCGAQKDAKTKDGWTALHLASHHGHLNVVKYLLASGGDQDAKTKDGWTPLHIVSGKGRLDVVQQLLANGADKEAKEVNGATPLHFAAQNGYLDVVAYLISSGANKEARTKNGWTPLHFATSEGHYEIVKHLVGSGANTEAREEDGETPLYIAAQQGHLDVVTLLVSSGANKEARTKDGWTAVNVASGGVRKFLMGH